MKILCVDMPYFTGLVTYTLQILYDVSMMIVFYNKPSYLYIILRQAAKLNPTTPCTVYALL